ncbi:kinase-like domain-containing protein [Rhizophagus irregularis DAOM 181602=DAOM 197198]|nr:kinase-like domain-containing protein [Rhizophagus irregularis DAOM 181602=DAOM 197198]
MEILNKTSKEKPRNLWKTFDWDKYQNHVTVSSINSATKSEEIDDRVIYMDDIEKRKEVYAEWPNGRIVRWDIENQKWKRGIGRKVALKSLDNSSEISTGFLDEIKSYLQIYIRKPINSSDLTSFQVNSDDVPSISTNLISECLDVQLSESDLNEIIQEDNLNDET